MTKAVQEARGHLDKEPEAERRSLYSWALKHDLELEDFAKFSGVKSGVAAAGERLFNANATKVSDDFSLKKFQELTEDGAARLASTAGL